MEAVKHELAHSKRDYSNSRALNKELQAQIDALLGSNAALDAMQVCCLTLVMSVPTSQPTNLSRLVLEEEPQARIHALWDSDATFDV